MSDEPKQQQSGETAGAGDSGVTRRVSTLDNAAPPSDGTSPLRWLFVIVPVLVLLATVVSLMGSLSAWSESLLRMVREEFQAAPEPERADPRRDDDVTILKPSETMPPVQFPPPDPGSVARPKPDETVTVKPFDVSEVVALLPTARREAGAQFFKVCAVCHTWERDAGHKIGPNLWGVVGRAKAASRTYAYSDVMRGMGGTWTYEELAAYLHNPRQFAPGTKMTFAGINDPARLANVIAYLSTLSDDPPPTP